jgi:superfamily II DNA or RNA helicase
MNLKLLVDNSSTRIVDEFRLLKGEPYKRLKKELGYRPEDYLWRHGSQFNDGYVTTVCYSRDKCRCEVKKDGIHFPTGLISKATAFLKELQIPFEVHDVRPNILPRDIPLEWNDTFQLRDYQQLAIERAVNQQRGLIKIATGGGKTAVGSGIISALGVRPTIFYVTSTDLLRQARDEIQKFVQRAGQKIKVGAVGGGYKDVQDITVMTVQTAIRAVGGKYQKFDDEDQDDNTDIEDIKKDIAELIHEAKLCICDEVQHWRADTCQAIADHSYSCRWRYGMSATPWRDAGDDILIDACFGKLIVDINASYLIQRGFLVKPYIAFVPITNLKGQDFGAWPTTYKQGIVENEYRNEWIAKLSETLVKNNRQVLILVQQIQHGEHLQSLIPGSEFIHGSSGKAKRGKHIELMQQGHAPVTISSVIFDEGIDVKPLNALILAGGGKSPTRALQRIGRVIRPFTYGDGTEKKDAFVYDLYDHLRYLSRHAFARRKIYKTEPEFEIEDLEI